MKRLKYNKLKVADYRNCYTLIYLLLISLHSCQEVIKPNLPKGGKRLVVEGGISNLPGPYFIKLTKTRDYSFAYSDTILVERGAEVIIEDNTGISEKLTEIAPGVYSTDSSGIKGIIGREYVLSILTRNGETYKSTAELLDEIPVIESLNYETINNDRHDGSWDFSVLFKIKNRVGVKDYFLISWFVEDKEKYYYLASDDFIDGKDLYSTITGLTYSPHSSKIKLSAISEGAFKFWTEIKKHTEEIGSPYDPPPTAIIGNVKNTKDQKKYALGYFNAYAVTFSEKIMVER
jgi:hypothetical protein